MARQVSQWRRLARRVIEDVLDTLPAGTAENAARKAVSNAYPWGPRQHHPYKMWCAEVRAVFAERYGSAGRRAKKKAEPPGPDGLAASPDERLWLSVSCGWCSGKIPGGCMACVKHHRLLAEVLADAQFRSLREAARADPAVRPVLGDWLEERLGSRCGL